MGSFRNITHILYDNSLKHNLCYLRNILLGVPVAGSDGILRFSLRYVGSVSDAHTHTHTRFIYLTS